MFTVKKTTLADARFTGYDVAPLGSNCNYTGQSVRWQVIHDGLQVAIVIRKKDAELLSTLCNEHYPDWDGFGDIASISIPKRECELAKLTGNWEIFDQLVGMNL